MRKIWESFGGFLVENTAGRQTISSNKVNGQKSARIFIQVKDLEEWGNLEPSRCSLGRKSQCMDGISQVNPFVLGDMGIVNGLYFCSQQLKSNRFQLTCLWLKSYTKILLTLELFIFMKARKIPYPICEIFIVFIQRVQCEHT